MRLTLTYKTLFLLILMSLNGFSQTTVEQGDCLNALLTNDYHGALKNLDLIKVDSIKNAIKWHIESYKYGVKDTIVTPVNTIDKKASLITILNFHKNAQVLQAHHFKQDSLVFDNLKKALYFSKLKKDTTLIRYSYHKLLTHLLRNQELLYLIENYSKEFKPYIKTIQDEAVYTYTKYTARANLTRTNQADKYIEVLKKFENSDDVLTKGILNQIIGISVAWFDDDHKTAISYYNLAKEYYEQSDAYEKEKFLFTIKNGLGYSYLKLGNPKLALNYYKESLNYNFGINELQFQLKSYYALTNTYESLKLYDSALHYSKKEKEATLLYQEHETALKQREIETKYKTAEKEKLLLLKDKEILIEQEKRRQNRNLLIASLVLLLFGGITALLMNKNMKRKQLLAEQDKELQTQKVATLLKEQELTAIDAMIEGQEKERQLIANDLHDDLGGLMTTVKWHFDALQKKQSPEMFKKTNSLIDEAYQKIRGIAHAKNSGVLASQGLLKAINNMAHKISDTNNLNIEVIDHGLEGRLENSLELTIFRIIQELIANAIKHANATEITIQITNYEDKLNIVVEDNGKGFDITKLSKTSGMGIHSIDKRIENLNGNVHIDSKVGLGTSVIIDIPT